MNTLFFFRSTGHIFHSVKYSSSYLTYTTFVSKKKNDFCNSQNSFTFSFPIYSLIYKNLPFFSNLVLICFHILGNSNQFNCLTEFSSLSLEGVNFSSARNMYQNISQEWQLIATWCTGTLLWAFWFVCFKPICCKLETQDLKPMSSK